MREEIHEPSVDAILWQVFEIQPLPGVTESPSLCLEDRAKLCYQSPFCHSGWYRTS